MSKVYVISDLHLGHKNMAVRYRGFQDVESHDEHIIDHWNRVIGKRDVVWILGDITMENSRDYHQLDKLKGIKKVILGNHDKPSNITQLLEHVNLVRGPMKYMGAWFTHIPMHPQELHGIRNIHGHIHDNAIVSLSGEHDDRYINVSAEYVNYKPQLCTDLLYKLAQ